MDWHIHAQPVVSLIAGILILIMPHKFNPPLPEEDPLYSLFP